MNLDSSDIKRTDQYIRNRRNPNDVDFEKEELRISTLSMDEPRDQSFIAHRIKDFSSLGIQGKFNDRFSSNQSFGKSMK